MYSAELYIGDIRFRQHRYVDKNIAYCSGEAFRFITDLRLENERLRTELSLKDRRHAELTSMMNNKVNMLIDQLKSIAGIWEQTPFTLGVTDTVWFPKECYTVLKQLVIGDETDGV